MEERLTVRLRKILRSPWAIPPVDCYRTIGTVHRGLEFGFLVIARDGSYLQINGSVIQALDREDVMAAIRTVERLRPAGPIIAPPPGPPAGPVTIVHKRRRIPAEADAAR
jgi:hypothetical protein